MVRLTFVLLCACSDGKTLAHAADFDLTEGYVRKRFALLNADEKLKFGEPRAFVEHMAKEELFVREAKRRGLSPAILPKDENAPEAESLRRQGLVLALERALHEEAARQFPAEPVTDEQLRALYKQSRLFQHWPARAQVVIHGFSDARDAKAALAAAKRPDRNSVEGFRRVFSDHRAKLLKNAGPAGFGCDTWDTFLMQHATSEWPQALHEAVAAAPVGAVVGPFADAVHHHMIARVVQQYAEVNGFEEKKQLFREAAEKEAAQGRYTELVAALVGNRIRFEDQALAQFKLR